MSNPQEMVRVSLDMPPELNEVLEELASKMGGSKSDVLRQAIALMQIIVKAKEQGQEFGISELNKPLATEIVVPPEEIPTAHRLETFIDTFGVWEDERNTEEIIKEIYDSRTISDSECIL
jgi:predicted transcriptional regulator